MRDVGVKQQPLLQWGQRQHVGGPVVLVQLVDLLLVQPRRGDIRRSQPAPTAPHMRANAGQRLKPQAAQPVHLLLLNRRGRPRPGGVQMRAGVGVDGACIELHGMRKRQWHIAALRRSSPRHLD